MSKPHARRGREDDSRSESDQEALQALRDPALTGLMSVDWPKNLVANHGH
jgi:hypothetical protein